MKVLLVAVSPEVAPTATRVCVPSATPDGTAAPNPLAPPLLPVLSVEGDVKSGGAGGAVEVDRHVLGAAEGGQRPAADHAGKRRQALAGADGEGARHRDPERVAGGGEPRGGADGHQGVRAVGHPGRDGGAEPAGPAVAPRGSAWRET